MLKELIDTYEELKKYVFVVNRGTQKSIIIKFRDENFYHLIGLHYTNIDLYIPKKIVTKAKIYKYLKKNAVKFEKTLKNQIQEKSQLQMRINTFHYIVDLLSNCKTVLYDLKKKVPGSMYDGDYGLLKMYDDDIYNELCCLFGLVEKENNEYSITCAPQSWIASNRGNSKLVYGKRPLFIRDISAIPIEIFNEENVLINNEKELV